MNTLDSLLRQTHDKILPPHRFVDHVMLRITSYELRAQRLRMCRSALLVLSAFALLVYALSELVFDVMLGDGFEFMKVAAEEPSTLLSIETHRALLEILPFPSIILFLIAFVIVLLFIRNFIREILSMPPRHAV